MEDQEREGLESKMGEIFVCIMDGYDSGICCTKGSKMILEIADDDDKIVMFTDEEGQDCWLSQDEFLEHYITKEDYENLYGIKM